MNRGKIMKPNLNQHKNDLNLTISDEFMVQILNIEMKEWNRIIKMREEWSEFFKKMVILILLLEIGLIVLVGNKLLVYKDEWFVKIILIEGFGQLLIMPYIVTKFLFHNNDNKLKNFIEKFKEAVDKDVLQ